ncbi:uncharacterized protein BDZ99DRAFT_479286 [Mytilinidion resinicola]|uniref:Uncharacterized protein n=1 Tax=Mytilinidion resinicola TaxID=574789 RepID=A0A6A6YDK3_9PEZI|nr:uncharacterized protein BDZ99DRAFT_479286 [Mytilinidion resinicola]KAF2806911.1 hypothetical protein BDZ99DRAFT_479286 [Mytilinidion resinicola]
MVRCAAEERPQTKSRLPPLKRHRNQLVNLNAPDDDDRIILARRNQIESPLLNLPKEVLILIREFAFGGHHIHITGIELVGEVGSWAFPAQQQLSRSQRLPEETDPDNHDSFCTVGNLRETETARLHFRNCVYKITGLRFTNGLRICRTGLLWSPSCDGYRSSAGWPNFQLAGGAI